MEARPGGNYATEVVREMEGLGIIINQRCQSGTLNFPSSAFSFSPSLFNTFAHYLLHHGRPISPVYLQACLGLRDPRRRFRSKLLPPRLTSELHVHASILTSFCSFRSTRRMSLISHLNSPSTSTDTHAIRPADVTERVTLKALELGYRHVGGHAQSQTAKDNPKLTTSLGRQRQSLPE